jgi:hypothetical protein
MLYNAYCQYILYTAYLDDIDYDVNGCEESIPGKLRGLSLWQLALQSVERNRAEAPGIAGAVGFHNLADRIAVRSKGLRRFHEMLSI